MRPPLLPLTGFALVLGVVLLGSSAPAAEQTQTAQSAMVSTNFDSTAYEIEGTITWSFDRGTHKEPGTAMGYYTNAKTGGPVAATPACSGNSANCGSSNAPSLAAIDAAQPAPSELNLQQHAQAERCTFFFGGTLTSTTYEQEATVKGANGNGNWKYVWTYTIAPVDDVQVAAHTAWTSEETGGAVDVGFSGFLASESFQKQSSRFKYSFTMIDGGATRARNVSAALQKSDGLGEWQAVASQDLNNVDTNGDLVNDGLATEAAAVDFSYYGNVGRFGNTAVLSALHATGGKPANGVVNILKGVDDTASFVDNFAGNNNDLAAGAVHVAPFESEFGEITEAGDFRVVISGVLKGNGGSAEFAFSVASDQTVIGGCTLP